MEKPELEEVALRSATARKALPIIFLLAALAILLLLLRGSFEGPYSNRGFVALILLATSLYLCLNRILPAMEWPFDISGGVVAPTHRSLRRALRAEAPLTIPVASLVVQSVRWIPADRVPSHCFVIRLAGSDGQRFRVDNRLAGPKAYRLLLELEELGKLGAQKELIAAMRLFDHSDQIWKSDG